MSEGGGGGVEMDHFRSRADRFLPRIPVMMSFVSAAAGRLFQINSHRWLAQARAGGNRNLNASRGQGSACHAERLRTTSQDRTELDESGKVRGPTQRTEPNRSAGSRETMKLPRHLSR